MVPPLLPIILASADEFLPTSENSVQEKFKHNAHFPGPIGQELPCSRPRPVGILPKTRLRFSS